MLGSGADPGPACAGTRASAAAAGTQADAPEGDAGRAPAPVPPRPTAGHAQSPRGAAGPLRRARRPPRGPARREVCARGAPLFVRFPGGGGGERVRRGAPPGTASCAPSRAPRPRFYTERGERRLCGAGRAGAGTLPRRALGPLRSVSLRAGRAMPPRARARSASLFWRRRARCAPCARFAGRAPQTMKPCGRCRGRASPGDRAGRGRPRGWGAAAPECAPGPPQGRAHGRPGGSRTCPTENDQGQWMRARLVASALTFENTKILQRTGGCGVPGVPGIWGSDMLDVFPSFLLDPRGRGLQMCSEITRLSPNEGEAETLTTGIHRKLTLMLTCP